MKSAVMSYRSRRFVVRKSRAKRAAGWILPGTMAATIYLMLIAASAALAQQQGVNYDESKVPAYTLPDPLVMANGQRVTSARMWMEQRRPELLKLFETYEYGHSPGRPKEMTFQVVSMDANALGGKAVRKEVLVNFTGGKDGPKMRLLIYLPKGAQKPAPMFLGLNFGGNQTVASDPGITINPGWMRYGWGVVNHRATEESRGVNACRWQLQMVLSRGYGLATAFYGDIEPDFNGGIHEGVRALYLHPGQTEPAADGWGAIGTWAWGLSRAMDYLETDKDVDAHRVAVVGHSRLGKTALWAGAQDTRFALVISNDSGEGGASLSRRWMGETVRAINTSFPWWFCRNFRKYNDEVNALPVDQHELLALIAPRPVYIATAAGDLSADPRGMFLAGKAADPVYRLLGTDGLGAAKMPGIGQPVMTTIGFHLRCGPHNVTVYDWNEFLDFADRHMKAP
jgi:(4-O-methyl)-D-glucuronate---lignin esterase